MVLLVRLFFPSSSEQKSLFTFHYGSISTILLPKYLISRTKFTFHYGSISTIFFLGILSGLILFTFHYGSISTKEVVDSYYKDLQHLHSTMVLLVREEF